MTPKECFKTFADTASPWSPWVKPVLFASAWINSRRNDPMWLDPWNGGDFDPHCAWVIDMPGIDGIRAAHAALAAGLRPIPLYNGADGPNPMIENSTLTQALFTLARSITQLPPRADAPPAFLLDSRRFPGWASPGPGTFDNRWMIFPQDFPSGNFLRAHGVKSVSVLCQGKTIAEDLSHVVLGWQKDGLSIQQSRPDVAGLFPAQFKKPSLFENFFHRALVTARLRRSSVGGFGASVPVPMEPTYGHSTGRFG